MESGDIFVTILYLLAHYWYVWVIIILSTLLILKPKNKKEINNKYDRPGNYEKLVNQKINIQYKNCPKCGSEIKGVLPVCMKCGWREHDSDIVYEKNNIESELEELREKLKDEIEKNAILQKKNDSFLDLQERLEKEKNTINNTSAKNYFKLSSGKYRGGKDIPVGIYNLKVVSGEGIIECNEPDTLYENISCEKSDLKYGYIDSYSNLTITEKTVLKINGATISLSFANNYDYSDEINSLKEEWNKEKEALREEYDKEREKIRRDLLIENSKVQSEINCLRSELKILNNQVIEKYYSFSDYDSITSEECKNKLVLLKEEEKELRKNDDDINVLININSNKMIERSIRQILRNFNSECDNIIMNIGYKNVDLCRNKIQKSFDTLNRLYSQDGISLTKELLNLKLSQMNLLYTYELKLRQEKEIQREIKAQMYEEEKAARELQEQKKKIEKDLQQHLSEVNRMMKYMQKSQNDIERQLYIDKIKELEEKIKVLESDKETVLEREANSKAGFVYIISNIGSFGENIYKIGMTRRLEPMERVHELSSASVPFEFDVHAMIFSSDAPELENMLHKHFAKNAVNKVNPRKEFFNVNIDEIEKVVKEQYNETVEFTKIPLATEYRQSMAMKD